MRCVDMCGILRGCVVNKLKAKLKRTQNLPVAPGSHDLLDAIIRESGKSQGRDLQHDGKALPEAPSHDTSRQPWGPKNSGLRREPNCFGGDYFLPWDSSHKLVTF